MGKLSFGQTGLSYECNKVSFKADGAPKCPRCQQRVYFNEERKAIGKSWHRKCFTCESCKKSLDSTNFNQANGEQIYCTSCYRKTCGPHVYGFVAGAMLPTTVEVDDTYKCQEQQNSNQHSNNLDFVQKTHSQSSFSSPQNYHYSLERHSSNEDKLQRCFSEVSVSPAERCGRCGKQVFFAEEVRVGKKKWHKNCFRCGHCGKYIEPGKCSDHDGDLFCRNCYSRFFGPSGYSSGNGSIFSTDVSSSSSSPSRGWSEGGLLGRESQGDLLEQSWLDGMRSIRECLPQLAESAIIASVFKPQQHLFLFNLP